MTAVMDRLGVSESLRLLGSVPVGRVVYTEQALPAIRPVNFRVVAGRIVLRGPAGSWTRRLHREVVAFEADRIDEGDRTGWSVVVLGRARRVTDVDELVALFDQEHRPWAPGVRDVVVVIDIEQITGRRVSLA
ncbi:pyridoxamine 5'-phosphate oxidase family protein [Prauserella flavalba]|uniref:Pyridoxamine 5'-phosphate oxidase n=1 Tax=Prauserella flavalba TaxID=1477506 RepID=A0A318LW79_9PSEU|nr:pyridoxamine 5'-phosphate oxidase family protein [Prauserella flavalba]PXY36737.1 hypothetical protein BA062_15405 [Prauserella flavalba]